MRDVLEVLAKLPPKCAIIDELGAPCFIYRGASGFRPADIPASSVDAWNSMHSVTEEQKRAMMIGASLGWDAPGADPDAQSVVPEQRPNLFTYRVPFAVTVRVKAPTEEAAAQEMHRAMEDLQGCFQALVNDRVVSIVQDSEGPELMDEERV